MHIRLYMTFTFLILEASALSIIGSGGEWGRQYSGEIPVAEFVGRARAIGLAGWPGAMQR